MPLFFSLPGQYDISCVIADLLVVFLEHQSTINPNMALRLFIYAARVYEKIIAGENIYSTKKLVIPQPRFFVLYNGTDPLPPRSVQRLGDLFAPAPGLVPPGAAAFAMDLAVEIININAEENRKLAEHCRTLGEYVAFIDKIREYQAAGDDLDTAIRNASVYCRDHDILREFLETHATEVLNMLFEEWNMDTALKVRYAEGQEEATTRYEAVLRQERERSRQERKRYRQERELLQEENRRLRKLAGLPDGE